LEAMTERKRGERPNNAMLVPEAIPRWFGKFFDAAKSEEKYENTVPKPAIKKKTVRRRNEVNEGCVISTGVLAISQENNPNPKKNKTEDTSEQAQGPYLSMQFPTIDAKGYWPTIPASTIVVS